MNSVVWGLVGLSFGMGLASLFHRRQVRAEHRALIAEVSAGASVLQCLRSGRVTEAIESLEFALSNQVFLLCNSLDSLRQLKRDPEAAEALRAARDYHTSHPLKTQIPDLDREVTRVLSKIS